MIKAVIFDMDGLILDTEKLLMQFWKEAAALYGFEVKTEHFLGIRSLSPKLAEPKLKGIFGEEFDYKTIRAKRRELMENYIAENGVEKKPGLDKLLTYLKEKGYLTAVATSTDMSRTTQYLNMAGVLGCFDKIVCAPNVKNGKPEPDIYIKAAAELGLPAGECLALEDSPNGIISAYRAGCMPVMIPDLSEPDEELLKFCAARLDDLGQVIDLLEKL